MHVLILYREIYHGKRWHDSYRFIAPMAIIPSGELIFLKDIITINYLNIGNVFAQVTKFFQKVHFINILIIVLFENRKDKKTFLLNQLCYYHLNN